MDFKNIYDLRIDHDLSQRKLVEELKSKLGFKIPATTYANYESGINPITLEVLEALSLYYNVTYKMLLGHANEKKTSVILPLDRNLLMINLRRERLRKKLTYWKAGKLVGLSETGYLKCERGYYDIRPDRLLILTNLYGKDIDAFCGKIKNDSI